MTTDSLLKKTISLLASLLAIAIAPTTASASAPWIPDLMGDGFEMRYVEQPSDYSGDVRCTVVRKLAPGAKRAVVYVHGYNDYFFQREMADTIVARGYTFYAVDLRKYGRSILPSNKPFEVRDLSEYFADIDSIMAIAGSEGIDEVALMGHSTGGLITAYYMATSSSPLVKTLILNSPFLDWNLGGKEFLVPAIASLGKLLPHLKIPQGESTAYAQSLLKAHHGEWDYNTSWKTEKSRPVEASWIRAIDRAQKALRAKPYAIHVPVLLLFSGKSIYGTEWTHEHQQGDAVLDVDDILRYGIALGPDVTAKRVHGGLHDLFLSAPRVRSALYGELFKWLSVTLPRHFN